MDTLIKRYKFWKYFNEISQIPRGSGNCGTISKYIADFASERNLRFRRDENDNVIIFKNPSPDCKSEKTVMLQGHMDMVAVKTDDCKKDMAKEGVSLEVLGDYLCARDTSLGADDGIGVAYMLAILDDNELTHPALECVFTTDEEIGMLGADALDTSDLKSEFMLNADSEEAGFFTAGCAGTTIVNITFTTEFESTGGNLYKITFSNLTGGHSGIEIDKNRGNAYRLLGRLLLQMQERGVRVAIAGVGGGGKDNAIAKGCEALVFSSADEDVFFNACNEEAKKIIDSYAFTDPDMKIECSLQESTAGLKAFSLEDTDRLICLLTEIPDGVVRKFKITEEMTETSLNLGVVNAGATGVDMTICARSNVEEQREYLKLLLKKMVKRIGAEISFGPETQIWGFRKCSKLRDIITEVYEEKTGERAFVNVIHAGVECGIFAKKMPGLDCVSFGPEIRDIHTFNERLNIDSAERYFEVVKETLERLGRG